MFAVVVLCSLFQVGGINAQVVPLDVQSSKDGFRNFVLGRSVMIEVNTGDGSIKRGTGFFISSNGWIMTARRNLEVTKGGALVPPNKIAISWLREGEHQPVVLKAVPHAAVQASKKVDIAIFKVKKLNSYPYLCVDLDPDLSIENKLSSASYKYTKEIDGLNGVIEVNDWERGNLKSAIEIETLPGEDNNVYNYTVTEQFDESMIGGAILSGGRVVAIVGNPQDDRTPSFVPGIEFADDIGFKTHAENCSLPEAAVSPAVEKQLLRAATKIKYIKAHVEWSYDTQRSFLVDFKNEILDAMLPHVELYKDGARERYDDFEDDLGFHFDGIVRENNVRSPYMARLLGRFIPHYYFDKRIAEGIYSRSIDLNIFTPDRLDQARSYGNADLGVFLDVHNDPDNFYEPVIVRPPLTKDGSKRSSEWQFGYEGYIASTREFKWSSSGKIISTLDLPGAHVRIRLLNTGHTDNSPDEWNAKRDIVVHRVQLQFNNDMKCEFFGDEIKVIPESTGDWYNNMPRWMVTIPSNCKEP